MPVCCTVQDAAEVPPQTTCAPSCGGGCVTRRLIHSLPLHWWEAQALLGGVITVTAHALVTANKGHQTLSCAALFF